MVVGGEGKIAETTQTFTKMLTLDLNNMHFFWYGFGLFQLCCSRPLTSKVFFFFRYGNKSLP